MDNKLVKNLQQIIDVLSQSKSLIFKNLKLPQLSNTAINTPIGDIMALLLAQPSPLPNQLINLDPLSILIKKLDQKKALIRLNHVGFCYRVASQEKEKTRIIDLIKKSTAHLYEEKSDDAGLWLFIGNIEKWDDPLMELIPVESTNDPDYQYWLPHIQIDIDTNLSSKEIKDIVYSIFGDEIKPFLFVIDGTTYFIRNRLGVIDGVNIFLDLATNARNVKYLRQQIWKKVA